jgi:MalT-like TPR region
MYQRKIAQWGLDKKHKAPEMRAILHLARQREATGQDSIFRIRGRRVDIEEVYRYFKRKGEDPTKLVVRDSPIPSTITVETPPPPPPPRISAINDEDFAEFSFTVAPHSNGIPYPTPETEYISPSAASSSSGSSTRSNSVGSPPLIFTKGNFAGQLIHNYPNMAVPIDLTLEDQLSRILLHLTQLFFDAVVRPDFYSQELSKGIAHTPWRRTMSTWSRATSEGYELMQRGQTKESFDLRSKAMDSVPKHIRNNSPIILFRYFEIIYHIWSSGDEPFLLLTLNHVLNMARTLLPPGHPIRELTRLLLHPQARSIIGPLAQLGIRKSLQILFERCGPRHPRILYVLESRTQTFLDENQHEKASNEAFRYLERAEVIRGANSYEFCQALRMLGDSYVGQGALDRATREYSKAFDLQRHLKIRQDRGVIGVKTKRGLAAIARTQAEYAEAEDHLQAALQMAKDSFGESDVQVMLVEKDLDALHEDIRQVRGELVYRPLDA